MTKQNWQERFDEKFGMFNLNDTAVYNGRTYRAADFVKDFLSQELSQAKQEGFQSGVEKARGVAESKKKAFQFVTKDGLIVEETASKLEGMELAGYMIASSVNQTLSDLNAELEKLLEDKK